LVIPDVYEVLRDLQASQGTSDRVAHSPLTPHHSTLPIPPAGSLDYLFYDVYSSATKLHRAFLDNVYLHAMSAKADDLTVIYLFWHGCPYSEEDRHQIILGDVKCPHLTPQDVEEALGDTKADVSIVTTSLLWQNVEE
jgi:hypothetical protein